MDIKVELEQKPNEIVALSPLVPQADAFPPIYNPNLDKIHELPTGSEERVSFREQELEALSEKINALPKDTFSNMRDREMERLAPYYDSFAKLYGIDLRAVARSRMQTTTTVMNSSVLLLQRMFPEEGEAISEKEGLTFFTSRLQGGAFQFNATSETLIEGYTLGFSVLKRTGLADKHGQFEVDYPAFNIDRKVFEKLQEWNASISPGQELSENPIIKVGAQVMSRRVHDWLHAAVLYDTNALTKVFQNWSDNSYFVKHIMENPAQINYELLSNHLHFSVWQKIFEEDPKAKEQVIGEAREYALQIREFTNWYKETYKDQSDDAEKMGKFLNYIGMRSIYDVIRYDDPELNSALKDLPQARDAHVLLPQNLKPYLDEIYKTDDDPLNGKKEKLIPFRKGSDRRLTVTEILREYTEALSEETRAIRNAQIVTAYARGISLQTEVAKLPPSILEQIKEQSVENADPRVYQQYNLAVAKMEQDYGQEIINVLKTVTEVDEDGFFYLKINRGEVDLKQAAEVIQKKKALLVQVPYDSTDSHEITLRRVNNLVSSQKGAVMNAEAGQVILVNTQNNTLAEEVLDQTKDENGDVEVRTFLNLLQQKASSGLVDLYDVYPYDAQKAISVFNLKPENYSTDEQGRVHIEAGHYETKANNRKAVSLPGPVSLDANGDSANRRRILSGAIVEQNAGDKTELDIFPVNAHNFEQFYKPSKLYDLPTLQVSDTFLQNHSLESLDINKVNQAILATLETFENLNELRAYGQRGKPAKVKVGDLITP